MAKVDVILSHPWRDEKDKLHEATTRVTVDELLGERLVRGGIGTFATKADAKVAGAPDAPTVRSK